MASIKLLVHGSACLVLLHCLFLVTALRDVRGVASGPEELDIAPNNTQYCLACQTVVETFKLELILGVSYEDLTNEAVLVCQQMPDMDHEYCDELVRLFAPHVFYIFDNRRDLSAADICGELLTPAGCVSPSEARDWSVDIQGDVPQYVPPELPEEGSPVLKVLHIADPHLDIHYMPGSNAACDLPLCCRNSSGDVLNSTSAAGAWGDYRNCGTPEWTLDAILQHIIEQHKDIDYVIWTGDVVPHNWWSTTPEDNLEAVVTTYQKIQDTFKDYDVFPVLGNHEAHPIDQYMAPNQGPEEFQLTWLYNEILGRWTDLLPDGADVSYVDVGGYYSVLNKEGLRIITINSMWGYSSNVWLVDNSTDPGQELLWLANELQKAEEAGELVHLLGHIPPGIANVERTWSREYNRIIQRYKNVIRGQFFGHTHWDEFEVFHDEDGTPINIGYVAPSLTTWDSYNPEYRIYTIDGGYPGASMMVLDHENWILDLEATNAQNEPVWRHLYSAKEDYSMVALSPADWQDFAHRAENDRSVFDQYFNHYVHASPPYLNQGCDDVCYKRRICDMLTSARADLEPCYEIS